MKLEIKHLAPYLPYKLNVLDVSNNSNIELNAIYDNGDVFNWREGEIDLVLIKPILRPLSDLTTEIMVNGEGFVPYEHYIFAEEMLITDHLECLSESKSDLSEDRLLPYSIIRLLFEWHFDVFGLIEKGLAIDINELKH